MIERAHIVVVGPAEAGKTTFLERLLRSNRSKLISATRLRLDPALKEPIEMEGGDEDGARLLTAGASGVSVVRCPPGDPEAAAETLWDTSVLYDFSHATVHEADQAPDLPVDLTVFVTRPLPKSESLFAGPRTPAEPSPLPTDRSPGDAFDDLIQQMKKDKGGLGLRDSHVDLARANLVLINVSGAEERRAATRLAEEILEMDADKTSLAAMHRLMQRCPMKRIVRIADLGDPRDPELKRALALVKRRIAKGSTLRRSPDRSASGDAVLQLRIELLDIEPPIWRRILIPADCTFWELHVAIQNAMGWTDSHLHAFETYDPRTQTETTYGIPDLDGFMDDILAGWDHSITNVLARTGDGLVYEYDFGDGWRHGILVEDLLPDEPGQGLPACLDGKRNCPPEDCGGVWGYEEFLEAIRNPNHENHEEMLEWIGGPFDPEAFDPAAVRFEDPKIRLRWILEG